MTNFIVKTHKKDTVYAKPHLFILNKGLNSGKPLKEECSNCFVLIFENSEGNESFYHIAYSLWKIRFWHVFLCGSVIPFLKISDFKREFFAKSMQLIKEHKEHQKNIATLKLLEQKEHQAQQNIKLINDLRNVILNSYFQKN